MRERTQGMAETWQRDRSSIDCLSIFAVGRYVLYALTIKSGFCFVIHRCEGSVSCKFDSFGFLTDRRSFNSFSFDLPEWVHDLHAMNVPNKVCCLELGDDSIYEDMQTLTQIIGKMKSNLITVSAWSRSAKFIFNQYIQSRYFCFNRQ